MAFKYELDIEELRARLRSRRAARELTWDALAVEAGVNRNVVLRIVNEGRKPSGDALMNLLVYLDVEPKHLLRLIGEPDQFDNEQAINIV